MRNGSEDIKVREEGGGGVELNLGRRVGEVCLFLSLFLSIQIYFNWQLINFL